LASSANHSSIDWVSLKRRLIMAAAPFQLEEGGSATEAFSSPITAGHRAVTCYNACTFSAVPTTEFWGSTSAPAYS
jgi:hypothetical protein